MYDFSTKKQIARRIADRQFIPVYRQLLEAARVPSCGVLMADQDALARDLVYVALDKYTEEQIIAACYPSQSPVLPGHLTNEATRTASGEGPAGAVKKNSRSSRNIRALTGRTWTALSSGLRTAYSRTASTAGRVFVSWRSSCRSLLQSVRSSRNT